MNFLILRRGRLFSDKQMILAQKIVYNVVFNTVTKLLSTVLALVSIGFMTRYLGRDGFGDYATVLAFFSFFSALLDLGLYSVTTREISRKGADEEMQVEKIKRQDPPKELADIAYATLEDLEGTNG